MGLDENRCRAVRAAKCASCTCKYGRGGSQQSGYGCYVGSRTLVGNERWFLAHTLPKGEWKAELHLGAQGFRTFQPQIRKTIRHARQLKTVRAPLFPRYLFVVLDLERDRWLSVRSTVGVSSLFGSRDGRPVPVPIGIVESLIERSDDSLTRLDND